MTWEQTKAARRAAGECILCRRPLAPGNKNFCPECRDRNNEYNRTYIRENWEKVKKMQYDRAKKLQREGKCTCCGKDRGNSGSELFCPKCLERNRQYESSRAESKKARYYTLRAAGLCTVCRKPSKKAVCDECRKK